MSGKQGMLRLILTTMNILGFVGGVLLLFGNFGHILPLRIAGIILSVICIAATLLSKAKGGGHK